MPIREYQGKRPKVAQSAYVDDTALVLGDAQVDEDASIWPMAVVRGDVNSIVIGQGSNIQDGAVLHGTHDSKYSPGGFSLRVGQYVTVGHRAILHACKVGDHCLIGMAATVMDGAVLEQRLMVGAGALVTSGQRLQEGYLYCGVPARRQRRLRLQEMEYLEYSALHYMRLKDEYLQAG